jgi:two-component system response regulator PilR (NtrC family)
MTSLPTPTTTRILVVDDEPDLRTLYELTLLRAGYQVATAATVTDALQQLGAQSFDVVITDMRLPDGLGLTLIQHLKAERRKDRCIVITAYGSAENAVESLKAGAFDYLTKPVDLKQFRSVVASAVRDTHDQVSTASPPNIATTSSGPPAPHARGKESIERLVGESGGLRLVKERVIKVARSMAPVLVNGESGTGKELVAQAIHANSHRADGPWVAVNCSAIPEALLEAEFFGSKKGAFTGATQDRDGFFQAASGGTLFLDEIGDLPLAMQSKLLRAIQERRVRPLGATLELSVDVRIVSATHKNLAEEVRAGRFRQDLFYRLNVIEIAIPPLRERREDLPALCEALLDRIARESGIPTPVFPPSLLSQLALDPLLGNVRELENLLHRAVALSDEDALQIETTAPMPLAKHLMLSSSRSGALGDEPPAIPSDLQSHLDNQERDILIQALHETGFNRTAAAARLGLSLRQMRYRIARLNIDAPQSGDTPDESY